MNTSTALARDALPPDILMSASFDATEADVRAQMVTVEQRLDASTIDPNRYNDMLLVLQEVLNNIVEHACKGTEDVPIDLSVLLTPHSLQVETRDGGAPLPPSLLSGGAPPEVDVPVDDLPEGGFGWFIIHSLVDDMMYERHDGRNVLSFTFELD